MDVARVIDHARAMRIRIQVYAQRDPLGGSPENAVQAQVCDFLRQYAGTKSAFLRQAEEATGYSKYKVHTLSAILDSFVEYLESGLGSGISPERKAQLDIVSDVLEQAHSLLEDEKQHPAAAAMVIGVALEQFLRTWVESVGADMGNTKPGIDAYSKALRAGEQITKQDMKDITAWAGVRNHAAHGEWDHVSDRARVGLMLEGVNLFIRQTTPEAVR